MKTILITGSEGFIGRNLCVALRRTRQYEVLGFDLPQTILDLAALALRADVVFHLAGVNRPRDPTEFTTGNTDLTRALCDTLISAGRKPVLAISSSIQAELDNPYGVSKRAAEEAVEDYHRQTGATSFVFRLPGVFGKWSRPNYNTVVATFCYNISRGLPVQVSNRENPLRLVYIDDVVRAFMEIAGAANLPAAMLTPKVHPVHQTTLGELHDLILSFKENRTRSLLPDLSDAFVKALYSTYLSFSEMDQLAYDVDLKTDERGWLFELVKSPKSGQIFVSRTKPGITRGNHFHDTKIEKFCVVQGEGVIRFRHMLGKEIVQYPVNDRRIQIVDIPPGYTHSIENTGQIDMLTLFWANEILDPQRPDTHPAKVQE